MEPIHTGGTMTVPETTATDKLVPPQQPISSPAPPPITVAPAAATTTTNAPVGRVPPELSRISEDSRQEKPSHQHSPQVYIYSYTNSKIQYLNLQQLKKQPKLQIKILKKTR